MSEPKWTPGPWVVQDTIPSKDIWGSGKTVGCAYRLYTDRGKEEQTANAHLIAAAPILYAELERVDPGNPALAKARGEDGG